MKALLAKIFGEDTKLSISATKGLRGSLTLVAAILLSNIDALTNMILTVVPDTIETVAITGLGDAGDITVKTIILFVLVGVANILKQSPFTKDNKLIRTIAG